jgi:hypothetical protein
MSQNTQAEIAVTLASGERRTVTVHTLSLIQLARYQVASQSGDLPTLVRLACGEAEPGATWNWNDTTARLDLPSAVAVVRAAEKLNTLGLETLKKFDAERSKPKTP